jgi:hypothetical protein
MEGAAGEKVAVVGMRFPFQPDEFSRPVAYGKCFHVNCIKRNVISMLPVQTFTRRML